jgi:hypothetical protein
VLGLNDGIGWPVDWVDLPSWRSDVIHTSSCRQGYDLHVNSTIPACAMYRYIVLVVPNEQIKTHFLPSLIFIHPYIPYRPNN